MHIAHDIAAGGSLRKHASPGASKSDPISHTHYFYCGIYTHELTSLTNLVLREQ